MHMPRYDFHSLSVSFFLPNFAYKGGSLSDLMMLANKFMTSQIALSAIQAGCDQNGAHEHLSNAKVTKTTP